MRLTAAAQVSAPPGEVFAALADLGTYPQWLTIVRSSRPLPAVAGDAGPAWLVELGARIGPVWRTKQVRMVRTEAGAGERVRFERIEHDGRSHSPWVLTAALEAAGGAGGTSVTVALFYGGSRWLPFADRLLRDDVAAAGARLDRLLRDSRSSG